MADYTFDFGKVGEIATSEKVKEIKYYTEISEIKNAIIALNQPKIKPMTLI